MRVRAASSIYAPRRNNLEKRIRVLMLLRCRGFRLMPELAEIKKEPRDWYRIAVVCLMWFAILLMVWGVLTPYAFAQTPAFKTCQEKYKQYFDYQDACNNNKLLYTPVCLYSNGSVKCGGNYGSCR